MNPNILPRAGRREWMGLIALALPCLLYSMDLSVLNLAIPSLTEALKPSSSQLLWIMDIYGFLVAGSLITMGTLGDRIGRRRLLLIGAAIFGLASVLTALSTSPGMLIASRALLGVAGATVAPSTLSLIRNMFLDERQRSVAISIWGACYAAGGAVGPMVGGLLLQRFWWGSVFLVAVPILGLLLIVGPLLLPEFRDPDAGRPDPLSAALSVLAVLAVIFGVKRVAEDGVGWLPMLSVLAGVGIGAVFVRRQLTLAEPLLDMKMFRVPAFSASVVTNLLCIFVAFGSFFYLGQYLQLVLGLSPLQAALWMLPSGIAAISGSLIVPAIVDKMGRVRALVAGLGLMVVGLGLLTQLNNTSGLALVVASSIVLPLGIGPVVLVTTGLVIGIAPPERAGAAAAISETGAELGGALGIAILGSIGTAIYRGAMAAAPVHDLPPHAIEAARGTLGGAVAMATLMPGRFSAELLEAARDAFTHSFETTAAIAATLALATGILALVVMRRALKNQEPVAQPDLAAVDVASEPCR